LGKMTDRLNEKLRVDFSSNNTTRRII